MNFAANESHRELIDEIRANFSVVRSTVENLREDLSEDELLSSYVFISDNIKGERAYVRAELQSILNQAKQFEQICINSPLQVATYKGNPEVIFEYRDAIRDFTDNVRRILGNLHLTVGRTLAAYILVYETLEKFGFKCPFVLVESNEFSSQNLINFIFGEFRGLGPRIEHKTSSAQIITYSGIDISNPLSLLIIGHEAFHIIDRGDGVFQGFCEATGFQGDKRSMEAFVDIMSSLYFGPVYTYAMQKYFEKRYPLSGESHPEMNIRLLILSFLQTIIGTGETATSQTKALNDFVRVLEKRMTKEALGKAKSDQKRLDSMLQKGVVGYVKHYFKEKNITPYDDFVRIVETREFSSDFEKINIQKMRFMLKKGIPVAARPIALLNALYTNGEIGMIDPKLIVASVKKWYVKRYYQKSIERLGALDANS